MSERHEEGRRKFLKQAATAAWATPLVLTLAANRAGAQAISCLPSLTTCGAPVAGGGCNTAGFVACCPGMSCVQVTGGLCRCT